MGKENYQMNDYFIINSFRQLSYFNFDKVAKLLLSSPLVSSIINISLEKRIADLWKFLILYSGLILVI